MNRIDDARVAFYLRNQTLIDEWMRHGARVPELAGAFLESCQDDIGSIAEADPSHPELRVHFASGYPKILLCKASWLAPDATGIDQVRVAIGLEWHRSKQLSFTTKGNCAHAGVWVNQNHEDGSTLSKRFCDRATELGAVAKHHLSSYSWWPVYRYEAATGDYWADLTPYRAQLRVSVRWFWETFSSLADELLG